MLIVPLVHVNAFRCKAERSGPERGERGDAEGGFAVVSCTPGSAAAGARPPFVTTGARPQEAQHSLVAGVLGLANPVPLHTDTDTDTDTDTNTHRYRHRHRHRHRHRYRHRYRHRHKYTHRYRHRHKHRHRYTHRYRHRHTQTYTKMHVRTGMHMHICMRTKPAHKMETLVAYFTSRSCTLHSRQQFLAPRPLMVLRPSGTGPHPSHLSSLLGLPSAPRAAVSDAFPCYTAPISAAQGVLVRQ